MTDILNDALGHFAPLDLAAFLMLVIAWSGVTLLIEHAPRRLPSTSNLMAQYRRKWMVQFVARDPRIFDSQIIGQLRQGTSFFASATLIAIGGTLALLGEVERLIGLADDLLTGTAPVIVWEVKILVIVAFLANAFLKFVWANRLFGYCAVMMAAVPNDPADPAAQPRAQKAAEINITAARGFNRGLRALYFALAAAAWLFGAVALLLAVAVTLMVLLRREFASHSRAVLMRPEGDGKDTRT
ncbi:DUF599 domain-containing protein [Roseovarius sp. A46]|uniref:DUF599 domain-containing protein n=1 Tax=Roseovarius sp. A46 TaxID=2109331 RepID=UPI001012E69B|nr:DUF599 domain-containing protein [Roseovarius sp. A46]RXV58932.1 DUF599 domain-containing protein [Roseovarius sp. A46]